MSDNDDVIDGITSPRLDATDIVLQAAGGLKLIREQFERKNGAGSVVLYEGIDVDMTGGDSGIIHMSNGQRFHVLVKEITGDDQIERGSFEAYWTPLE